MAMPSKIELQQQQYVVKLGPSNGNA
jgi:hypothetical protein